MGGSNGSSCTATSPFASGFGYNTALQVTGFNYGNGVVAAFGYSADRLQLTSLAYTKNTTTLLSLAYGYTQGGGNNGQIVSITDNTGTQEAGRSVTYSYDALYRLSTAVTTGSTTYPQWGLSWTYDRYGNRTAQTVTAGSAPSNSVTVSATTNRIIDPGYGYDPNGNMTNDGANALTYDAESCTASAAGVSYTYDGNSLRVKKVSGGTTTVYVFSGTKVIAEYSGTSAPYPLAREYIYSGSALVATIEGSTTKYHHPDHLFLRVTTDSSGVKVADSGHYPFGENWYETSGMNKLKFTSYERDSESGNDYAMMRSYVNRLARFSSPDPLGGSVMNPQSLNRYSYVQNDPLNLIDPFGLLCYYVDSEGHVVDSDPDVDEAHCKDRDGLTAVWVPDVHETVTASAAPPPGIPPGVVIIPDILTPPWGSGGGNTSDPQKPNPKCNRQDPTNAKVLDFIQAHRADAQAIASQLNVPVQNILGLSAQESAYGQSSIAQNAHNYFGLHAGAPGSTGTHTTSGGATVSAFPSATGYILSGQAFASTFGSLVQNQANAASFANALVPKFNTANAKTGGNPDFRSAVTGAISAIASRLNCP